MMSTCCSKHVQVWNKYSEKECVKLVINQNWAYHTSSNRNVTRIFRIGNFKIELISTLEIVEHAPAVAKLELLPPEAMVLSMNTSRPWTKRPNTWSVSHPCPSYYDTVISLQLPVLFATMVWFSQRAPTRHKTNLVQSERLMCVIELECLKADEFWNKQQPKNPH
jgi:hypothetical protein